MDSVPETAAEVRCVCTITTRNRRFTFGYDATIGRWRLYDQTLGYEPVWEVRGTIKGSTAYRRALKWIEQNY